MGKRRWLFMDTSDFGAANPEEGDDDWVEQMLEDDEVSDVEAGFMKGYREAENEGFEQ